MAESTTSTSQTEASPLTGPSSFGSIGDAQGLPAIKEASQHRTSHDFNTADHRLVSMRRPSGGSHDASLSSSMAHSYNEKSLEELRPKHRYTAPANAAREAWQRSEGTSAPMTISQKRDAKDEPKTIVKEKRNGLKNTIRRMFGRRPAKERISMPNPMVYPPHNPEEFITSATGVDVKKERSASVPNTGFLRTSGLASHPPSHPPPKSVKTDKPSIQPPAERRTPERPPRPRRASVPSILLNRDEVQAVSDAVAGLAILDSDNQIVDARNIGFAVTNGSNPKRRSRSVGAAQADHRMSPIQWRNVDVRRRSDEIKHWRESADLVSSHAVKNSWSPEMPPNVSQVFQEKAEDGAELGEHSADFNFGLPPDDIQSHERMGLEERLVTLELKLMDVEYSISKLQAGSTSPSRPHSHGGERHRGSGDSYVSSDFPQGPEETSPHASHGTSPNISYQYPPESNPKARPISVATTMKAVSSGQHGSHRKGSADLGSRSSLTGLTVEHYTTLVSLIRNERSARLHLEEQVSQLQKQVERLSQSHSLHSHQPSISHSHSRSQLSHTYSESSHQRRHGMVEPTNTGGAFYNPQRRRSSSYSTNETDTDDDVYYVTPEITPVERGEYERGAFERVSGVAEGAAF